MSEGRGIRFTPDVEMIYEGDVFDGSVLDKLATNRSFQYIQEQLQQSLTDMFAVPENLMGRRYPQALKPVTLNFDFKSDTGEGENIQDFYQRWLNLVGKPQPSQQTMDIVFGEDELYRLENCDVRNARKVYIVSIHHWNGRIETIKCNKRWKAEHLTRSLNGGSRTCRGPYQKYQLSCVCASMRVSYLVTVTVSPVRVGDKIALGEIGCST